MFWMSSLKEGPMLLYQIRIHMQLKRNTINVHLKYLQKLRHC